MGIAGRSAAVLVAILLAALPVRSAAQEPSLEEVLARAAAYVSQFHEKLSGIVAEEHYRQEVKHITGRTSGAGTLPRKTLTSDLLLVRPPDADRYVEFRDVFEVNGTPVRDRDKRLEKLFLKPTATTFDQVRDIVDESARHNIGDIPRNINTPMLTLHFLQKPVQHRFRFKRADSGRPELGNPAFIPKLDPALFRVTTEMWILEYKETSRPTIIRTNHGRDFPASGRFWVNPETGAVLMSELVMQNSEVNAVIDVSYQSEPLLGFMVPAQMRERYRGRSDRVEGIATYGRFRQFQVKTEEAIAKPPGALQ
jgi:hypothetical protein